MGIEIPIKYKVEENGCYKCISHKGECRGGYIELKRNKKKYVMSRYLFELKNGILPREVFVRHKCDNKWCINTDHMETGSNRENQMDEIIRQGKNLGENARQAKITLKQAIRIKEEKGTLLSISKKYNIGISQVHRIKKGLSWNIAIKKSRGDLQ